MLPARVTLSLYFFQETRDKKKLVASLLKLHSYHDPRPEGVYTKDGKTLIEPRDLSPPACCIIQRHPTKCSEIYIDDNGKEKTMQIPSKLGVPRRCLHFNTTRVHLTSMRVVSMSIFEAVRTASGPRPPSESRFGPKRLKFGPETTHRRL